jgi:hypothetical protein
MGRRFVLITDHKAIESIKTKKEFGSGRIKRWFERLERFDFEIKYRSGKDLIGPDALSRAQKVENENIEVEEEVLKFHCENNHRKTIKELPENKGILLSSKK